MHKIFPEGKEISNFPLDSISNEKERERERKKKRRL